MSCSFCAALNAYELLSNALTVSGGITARGSVVAGVVGATVVVVVDVVIVVGATVVVVVDVVVVVGATVVVVVDVVVVVVVVVVVPVLMSAPALSATK